MATEDTTAVDLTARQPDQATHPRDEMLAPTPFISTGDLATVAPAWARTLAAADDVAAAARTWFDEHPEPVEGPVHVVDGVRMLEVSFLAWADDDRPRYLFVGAMQWSRRDELTPFRMHPVGDTPLHQLTYLLPTDGTYTWFVSAPDADAFRDAQGIQRLQLLFEAKQPQERDPHELPSLEQTYWQGPDFPAHPAIPAEPPTPAEDVEHCTVTHADGRKRDVWTWRAPSGTSRTVVLFDGDAWRELGFGGALWAAAGHDANLVLMSSMEQADRTPDLTDHERTAQTLGDVLTAVSARWDLTLTADDVVLVGQSFGGLGVVGVVLQHPDLAASGVCISGSFFFLPDQGHHQETDQVGVHRLALRELHAPAGRLVLISGRDEVIAQQSLDYLTEARAHGVDVVAFRHLRGTHEYAWWRHAILHGLDLLLGVPDRA